MSRRTGGWSPWACILAGALLPAAAAAQSAPRSLALELGWSADSAAALGTRFPVALAASWWIGGDADATARVAWSSAARTDGRGADGAYEAGAGVRYVVARWGSLRQQLGLEVAALRLVGPGWSTDVGLRLGATAAVEAFLHREIFLGLAVRASDVVLAGGGGVAASASLGVGSYF